MHALICWIAALAAASPLIALPETNQAISSWKEGPRFPVPDHDITGATLGSSFYVAGGCAVAPAAKLRPATTINYGCWILDYKTGGSAATLPEKRFYCATVAFDKKIWIISGSIVAPDGTTHPDSGVRIYDPSTGNMGVGPSCLTPRSMPLALVANNRIYLMGNKPGGMESIGLGEKVWRTEPNPPPGDGPFAGASLNEKLFVMMPGERGWEFLIP